MQHGQLLLFGVLIELPYIDPYAANIADIYGVLESMEKASQVIISIIQLVEAQKISA